jgi:hypothetical protein
MDADSLPSIQAAAFTAGGFSCFVSSVVEILGAVDLPGN